MCATCIGSTFAHSPVWGLRKSGMPDGTEMPAPVSATTERAPRTRRASRWIWARLAGGRRHCASARRALLALEVRAAFGEEGRDALLGIRALEDLREGALLRRDAL